MDVNVANQTILQTLLFYITFRNFIPIYWCMNKKKRFNCRIKVFFSALFAVVAVLSLCNCSVTRKISAADILLKTKLSFDSVTLDSVEINKDLFPKAGMLGGLLPNPQVIALVQDFAKGILEKEIGYANLTAGFIANNQSEDTLWIKELTAVLKLDTIMDLPVKLPDSVRMVPGDNRIEVSTKMPIDRNIFSLKDVSKIRLIGKMNVSLEAEGTLVPFDIDIDRSVSHEEKVALMDKARNSVLNGIVNDWVGAIDIQF